MLGKTTSSSSSKSNKSGSSKSKSKDSSSKSNKSSDNNPMGMSRKARGEAIRNIKRIMMERVILRLMKI